MTDIAARLKALFTTLDNYDGYDNPLYNADLSIDLDAIVLAADEIERLQSLIRKHRRFELEFIGDTLDGEAERDEEARLTGGPKDIT